MSIQATYTEPELITLLKQGDQTAYSYLYDHYGAALYGVILQMVKRQEVAEDILQEVFLKIYRNIGHYEKEKGKLYTWMFQITRNTAIDTLRSRDFRKSQKIQALDNNVNDNTTENSNATYVDHLGLEKVLSALNKDQQKVIDLAYFNGYTQKEIAQELEVPLGTVKTRVRNALIELRKLLNIS